MVRDNPDPLVADPRDLRAGAERRQVRDARRSFAKVGDLWSGAGRDIARFRVDA